MSLEEIKDKLYKKESYENPRLSTDNVESAASNVASEKNSGDQWEKRSGLGGEQKKIIKIGATIAGSILIVFLIFVGIYEYKQSSFGEDKVQLSVTGPSEGDSGRTLVFEIKYANLNRASLKNAELRVSYPENFKPEGNYNFKEDGLTAGIFSLGEISGRSEGKVFFTGKAYNPKGTLIYIKTDLYYVPSNFNSQFVAKNQIGVAVTSSPIILETLAPRSISSGDSIDYLISYKNVGGGEFENIKITADYPEGFSFSKSVPASSEGNNVWYIGHLSEGQDGKIVISGKLEGSRDDIKEMKAQVGSFSQGQFVGYNEGKVETKIVTSPLSISQAVNGLASLNVKAGDTLFFSIKYKNEGGIGLRDVIISQQIDSPALDYETLNLKKGAFDIGTKTITWKASDFASLKILEPGKEGAIDFSIKVKDTIPVKSANDKNFVISSIAKIDSPDIPTPIEMNRIIAGNKMDMRLNSKMIVDMKGYFNDPNIANSGPIPPKVGQETTYSIHWLLTNVSNDISDARVEADLPTGAVMTGKIYPEGAKITYNERNNSIIWDAGNISAGTGILTAPKEIVFQVKIKPAPSQAGREADLVGQATLRAKDLFTQEDLTATAGSKNTALTEDPGIGTAYRVTN